jgi:hypothetical protein
MNNLSSLNLYSKMAKLISIYVSALEEENHVQKFFAGVIILAIATVFLGACSTPTGPTQAPAATQALAANPMQALRFSHDRAI